MTIKIETDVYATWPADDITIRQDIIRHGNCSSSIFIGLNVDEVDTIIEHLKEAKAKVQAYKHDFDVYCEQQKKEGKGELDVLS
jgi:hypothetical protein